MLLVAALNAVPGLLGLTQTFPPGLSKGGLNWGVIGRALLNPAIILLALLFLLYSSLEVSTGGWLRTYLEQEFNVSAAKSSTILAVFFALMLVGRLIGSEITKRMRGSLLVLGCALGAIAGLVLLALAWNVNVAMPQPSSVVFATLPSSPPPPESPARIFRRFLARYSAC